MQLSVGIRQFLALVLSFGCRSGFPCMVFMMTGLHTCGVRLLSSEVGFSPYWLPCMQRFMAFFTPLLQFNLESTRKEAQCARQSEANRFVAKDGGVAHKHAPCQRLSLEMTKLQYVDDF